MSQQVKVTRSKFSPIEFSTSQQGKSHDDLRLVVKRDSVTIGVIFKDGDQYQLVLLRSRATFDSSVIKAYAAEDCDDFGTVELRSPSIDKLKRFAVEAVQGFAKPVTTTVIDGDRVYLVRRVSPGNEYGFKLRNSPPLVAKELLIEFYLKESPRYSWKRIEEIHGPMGCFVSRYRWSTLADPQYDSEILDLGMGCEISRQSVKEALHTLRQLTISAQ